MPVPATRSMASLGLTYSFSRPKKMTPANRKNTTKLKKKSMPLHLYVRDLLHDDIADNLKDHRATQHDVADVVRKEKLHVIRIGVEHQDRHADRNASQSSPGHAPVRADGPDAAAQLET